MEVDSTRVLAVVACFLKDTSQQFMKQDGNIHLRNLSVNMAQKEEDAQLGPHENFVYGQGFSIRGSL